MHPKLLLIPLLLLCLCDSHYDAFWNPNTFSTMAPRNGFVVNGTYRIRDANKVTIMAVHQPSGTRGLLHFTKSTWPKDDSVCVYISLMFEADTDCKEAYSTFLKNNPINSNITLEPDQAPVIKPGISSTSTGDWMRKDL